jgi:hypothetical protein
MSAATEHRRYVLIFVAACAVVLLPVVALNYLLGLRSLGGNDVVLEASRWQQATRGVTYAPPLSANRPFKSARLFDRLPDINAIVFGSSTMMGLTQDHFPQGLTLYNFSQTGNELPMALGEAEYMLGRYPGKFRVAVIPLDWALGFLYRPAGEAGQMTVAAPVAGAPSATSGVPIAQQLQDALSLPRVKNLFSSLLQIARGPAPAAAFSAMFFGGGNADYRCADGTPARDFDTIFRGTCTGFRFDGSATFANLEPVAARRVEALIAGAVVPSSKYAVDLIKAGGIPDAKILERLAQLARAQRTSGGQIVLIMPPLLPGMERAFAESPQLGPLLGKTKEALAGWARTADVAIIDAGRSERYGCEATDFVDEHHALPACYARVFARFWQVAGGISNATPGVKTIKLPAGLYAPQ